MHTFIGTGMPTVLTDPVTFLQVPPLDMNILWQLRMYNLVICVNNKTTI